MTIRITAFALTLALLAAGGPASAQQKSPSVLGQWLTDDRSGIIEIAPCGSQLCGTLVKVLDPAAPDKDVNNPDPALRNQSLVGVRILSGRQRKDGRWDDGEAYDPKAGRSYRARIALASPDRLDVTGCVLFVCRTKHWTRVGKDRNR